MTKITLSDTVSGFSLQRINDNFQKIANALNNEVLYKDGGTLDGNGYRLLNTPLTHKLRVDNAGVVSATPL